MAVNLFKLVKNKEYVVVFHTGSSAFTAVNVAVNIGTSDIRFPTVLYNEGGDYNPANGVYTARVPGVYWFSATVSKGLGTDVDYVPCYLRVNSENKIRLYTDPMLENDRDGYSSTGSAAFRLQAGDRVQVGDCTRAESILSYISSHFSGFLIKPDF